MLFSKKTAVVDEPSLYYFFLKKDGRKAGTEGFASRTEPLYILCTGLTDVPTTSTTVQCRN